MRQESEFILSWPVIFILVLCVAIGTLNISYLTRYTATKHHSCHHTAVKITLVQISTPQGTVAAGIYPTELPFMFLDNSEAFTPVSDRQRSPVRNIYLRSNSGLGGISVSDWWRGGWGKVERVDE